MPCALSIFARQVQPVPAGIFCEVAKDVSELPGSTEFRGDTLTGLGLLAEDPHREPADRDGGALAVQIQFLEARRAKVGTGIHFHTVDNGEEIAALQALQMHGFAQSACDRMLWAAGVEQRNFAAPVG